MSDFATARRHDEIGASLPLSRGAAMLGLLLLAGSMSVAGCRGRVAVDDGGHIGAGEGEGGEGEGDDGFADHTVHALADRAAFDALSAPATGSTAAIFLIDKYGGDVRDVRFLDSNFYQLHDEWYWFRLLNGARVPGLDDVPVSGLHFETIAEIYTWALAQETLPLDLRFIGGRLYSQHFYDISLFVPPKQIGLGTLMHFDARPDAGRAEVWVWQLEYQDVVSAADIKIFFDELQSKLPADIWAELKWVVRSPAQETLAEQMEVDHAPYFERIIRYRDLTIPGDVAVYNQGLSAGRLRIFRSGDTGIADTTSSDIVVVEDTPDNLPQCAGFITANPQTALAHVNVIAKTRAIPNVYVSGILDDANLAQLAAARAPVALRAIAATDTEPAHVDLVPMTEQELATYRSLSTVPPLTVEQPDFSAMPYVVDLTVPDLAHQDEWRLVIGGKSMGIAGLLDVAGVGAPDKPLGISVRPYHEHIEAMRAQLVQMMADPAFSQSVLVRLLVLEGTASYDVLFPSPTDQRFKQDFLDAQPAGTVLGDIAAAGGVQQMIKDKPIDPAALQSITNVLETAYGNYSAAEGLRFRSSTQIEDSEVFQGVGIGLSFTGYLRAAQLPDTDPHHAKTVERAIKEVWAAYWRSAGYEERQLANIDQLSANMGVTVHARSDDHDELANGDLFVTLDPPNFDDVFTLELDVQPGATPSVTNPGGSTDLPEHDVMHQARSDGAVTIERVQHATLNPTGFVLDDADLATIFDQMTRTAQYYFDTENEPATDGQRRRTLTLDVEFRKMAANWPETIDGTTFPERIIFRQAASVFPSTARIPASVKALPIPLDVLSHAQRIEQRVCTSPAFRLTTVETYTNPLVQPDLGFAAAPFTSSVDVEVLLDEPSIGASLGDHLRAEHPVFATQGHDGMQTGGPWNLDVTVADVDSAAAGFTRLRYTADGAVHVDNAAGAVDEPGGAATCERTVLYATPEDFLKDIIASTPGGG